MYERYEESRNAAELRAVLRGTVRSLQVRLLRTIENAYFSWLELFFLRENTYRMGVYAGFCVADRRRRTDMMQAPAQIAAVAAAVAAVACLGFALLRPRSACRRKRRTQTDAAYVALIGNTPMVQLARLSQVLGREIWVKVSGGLLHSAWTYVTL